MGTNYFWTRRENCCEHCNRADEETLHIGKSSAGWHFSLRVYPDEGINTLEDWKARFAEPNSVIKDEYGEVQSVAEMIATITERGRDKTLEECLVANGYMFYNSVQEMLTKNSAVRGKKNLMAHDPNTRYKHCIGHGEGTWDYIIGEFS